MIRPLLFAVLLIGLPLTVARAIAEPAPAPVSTSSEPYELVRSLQAVQDGIANGDTAAHGSHIALIRQIGEKFLAADPGAWTNAQNGQAVVIYLLSGGAPQIVRKLPSEQLLAYSRVPYRDIDSAPADPLPTPAQPTEGETDTARRGGSTDPSHPMRQLRRRRHAQS